MRLGYLVPEFPGQTHAFFWREIQALRDEGVEVVIFSTSRPPPHASRHAFAGPAREETSYLWPPRLPHALRTLAETRRTGRALRYLGRLSSRGPRERARQAGLLVASAALAGAVRERAIDHLHVHSMADSAHLAALQRQLGGCPYSLTLHGDLEVYGRDHESKVRDAEFVACVTRALQRSLVERLSLSVARAPVLWMGVDTARFEPPAARASGAGLELVSVARLNTNKGHRFALRALRGALDRGLVARYVIAGEGPERPALEAEIRELRLGDRVTLAGTLSEDSVAKLLAESNVFVLPSVGRGEAAPVSLMEAMAAGLPVVCSVIGGVSDMVQDGSEGLLVAQGDVSALESAFLRLAADPPLRERLGRAARKRAVADFDHRSCARRLLAELRAAKNR